MQAQLVESEKMASLGLLVSNVAHEINTPIGAVKASGKNITDAIEHAVLSMPSLFRMLDQDTADRFVAMLTQHSGNGYVLNTREERLQIKALTAQLEPYDLENPRLKASILVQMGIRNLTDDYLPLLLHAESDRILATARSISTIINNSQNINYAVERVSKIVYALKAFSSASEDVEMVHARVHDGIENVLTQFQTHLQESVTLVREFDLIPPLWCVQEDLKQAWNHLILNAMQAMNHVGTLTISIRMIDNEAVVAFTDTGTGIPADIQGKIFDAFFTTRTSGEGSGLGLAIVQKIIDKHHGRITVHSEVGAGATLTVFLPYPSDVK
jgi:signal transduction histidine kinase